MRYNLTNVSGTAGTVEFLQAVNQQLGGFIGIIMLVVICAVAFISFYTNTRDPVSSIAATSFIAFGLSILLAAMNLLATNVLFITLTAAAISLAFSWQKP